MPENTPS